MAFKVSVILGFENPEAAAKVVEGSVVELVLDDNNEHDADAVAVEFSGEHVGFVCNTDNTLGDLPGIKSASDLRRVLEKGEAAGKKVARLTMTCDEQKDYTSASGTVMRRFVGEVHFVKERAATTAASSSVKTSEAYFGGATMRNPKKLEVITALEQGSDPIPLKLQRVGVKTGAPEEEPRFVVLDASGARVGSIISAADPNNGIDELDAWFDAGHQDLAAKATGVVDGKTIGGKGKAIQVEYSFVEESADKYLPMIDDAIAAGKGSEDVLLKKLSVMTAQHFKEKTIRLVFDRMNRDRGICEPPTIFRSTSGVLEKIVTYKALRKNVILYGPASSGKNTANKTACWLLNVEETEKSGSGETAVDDLAGGLRLINGETVVAIPDHIRKLAQRDGADFVLDEADMVPAEVLAVFHSAMDFRRSINIEGHGEIKLDPKSTFTFTMNRGYEGCKALNKATKSRFVPIFVPAELTLAQIFADKGFDPAKLAIAQTVTDEIIRQTQAGVLEDVDVFARCVETAMEASEYMPLNTALKDAISAQIDDEYVRSSVEGIIDLQVPITA